MIVAWSMLAMSAFVPVKGAETFDLADTTRRTLVRDARATEYLLPEIDEPAPPERARLRVRGRMVKWRVPLGSF